MDTETVTREQLVRQTIDRFWETVPPVWNIVRCNVRSIATERFEISVEQFHILRHIRRGIVSISELADVKGISRPAISQAVDLLVDKGLIARQQDKDDRRYVRLALTPSGDELLNKIFQQNRAWMSQKFSSLDPGDLVKIAAALEILRSTFEEPSK
jgi:DNA-binding MarR family transcriptional regulator